MRYGPIGGWRRVAAVGLPALLVAVSGAVIQWVRLTTRSATEVASAAYTIAGSLNDMLLQLSELGSASRAYLLTGDSATLGGWRASEIAVGRDLDRLSARASAGGTDPQLVPTLQPLIDARLTELHYMVAARSRLARDTAARRAAVESGRATMDSVRAVFGRAQSRQGSLMAADAQDLAQRRTSLNIVVIVGTTLSVVAALFVNAMLTRYARDRERSAALLAAQAQDLERHNAALRDHAREVAATNRELEQTTARLQATTAELVRTAADRERARQAAETANRAKGDFLAAMSHELRTPLNAIVGYASLLEEGIRGPMPEEQRTDVARIVRAARHLLGLINDLLSFARLEAGQLRIERGAVPVDEVLAAAAAMMEVQARVKHVTLIPAPCDPPVAAFGDHDKTLQIIVNLLSNAVKFTGPGGRIELISAADERSVRITISDTGRGIAPENLTRIFEPFVQVERQVSSEGVGLGLAISRDLARAMGGDLTVVSTEGSGSAFTLMLPRMEANPAPAVAHPTATAYATVPSAPVATPVA